MQAGEIGEAGGRERGEGSQWLGKYQLLRPLAVGGMAELHLARVVGIGGVPRIVVVKRMHPRLAADGESVRLFEREAKLMALLHHPNVAQVCDAGEIDGNPYLVMEHVAGLDLRIVQWAANRTPEGIPFGAAIGIMIGACAGLHHAHEQRDADGELLGIVHRDVSPSNLLVSYDGWTKLVDFGIAKMAGSGSATRLGAVRGKTSYLSPEQCRCEDLDRRSDVFALGIVLWELTTGRRLFVGRSDLEVYKKITEEPVPPPSLRRAGYPLELERIVLKALAPLPDDRYQTARELQLDLEDFARERKLCASPTAVAELMARLFAPRIAAWEQERLTGRPPAAALQDPPSDEELSREAARASRPGAAEGPAAPDPGDDEADRTPTRGDIPSGRRPGRRRARPRRARARLAAALAGAAALLLALGVALAAGTRSAPPAVIATTSAHASARAPAPQAWGAATARPPALPTAAPIAAEPRPAPRTRPSHLGRRPAVAAPAARGRRAPAGGVLDPWDPW